jgi:hypothetical protein
LQDEVVDAGARVTLGSAKLLMSTSVPPPLKGAPWVAAVLPDARIEPGVEPAAARTCQLARKFGMSVPSSNEWLTPAVNCASVRTAVELSVNRWAT